jgi:hypothetical protein
MATTVSSPDVTPRGSSVSVDTLPGAVRLSIRFENSGRDSVLVTHGACSFGVRLYRPGATLSDPAWDNRPDGGACILPLYGFYVPALGARDVGVGTLSPSALVGKVPAGTYDAAVTWRVGDVVYASRAGTISVPAR